MKPKAGVTVNLISVEEALTVILKHFGPLEPERVPMLDALDRVLTEDIVSDINVPPFQNSAMDGYAVRAEDIAGASTDRPASLRVIGDLAAGHTTSQSVERGTAMRIMTGAPLPPGADTVVQFEATSEGVQARAAGQERETANILKAFRRGDNVRAAGEDIHAGEVVLPKGTIVRPAEIGVLASLGKQEVSVHRRPRVAILATGDELVTIDEPITPGKIRNSNEYANAAAVVKAGGVPVRLGIARDNIDDLTAKIRAGLDANADLFLTSAGVSVGDYDMVKDVLNAEGEMHFWQVRMKPGKPLAFGILRGKKDVPLLGLPGNPVSAMISFEVFARPAILAMQGKSRFARPTIRATLLEDVQNAANRRNFIRVVVEKTAGGLTARTTGEQGSGILTSVSRANGLLVVPEDVALVPKGSSVDVQMLDWPEWG
jgi:molybdopterin molybdotransferase